MQPVPQPRFEPQRPLPPAHFERGRPQERAQPIYVQTAPPPVRREVPTARPSPGHVWIGGYWGWQNDQHVWIEGQWATPPRPGYAWEPARWRRHGHRWTFVPGHWHAHGRVWVEPGMAAPPDQVYATGPAYVAGDIAVSGYVTSPQGAPVAGITVTLAGSREGRSVTDGSGYYVFSGLAPGSYAIRATGPGCAFVPDVVNLSNLGGSVTQNIIVSGCGGW